jgi:hypothetical protein
MMLSGRGHEYSMDKEPEVMQFLLDNPGMNVLKRPAFMALLAKQDTRDSWTPGCTVGADKGWQCGSTGKCYVPRNDSVDTCAGVTDWLVRNGLPDVAQECMCPATDEEKKEDDHEKDEGTNTA